MSLATLTTVEYGDVSAVSRPARVIAVLEAITGKGGPDRRRYAREFAMRRKLRP